VEICNLALDLLRHSERVTSIEDPESDTEGLAARWYDVTREALLRSYPWNFARARKVLSRNAVAPDFGYPDAYNLPSDYLQLLFIGDNYLEQELTDFAVEGGQILVDNSGATSLNIGYVRNMTNVPQFDPLFKNLLALELAIVFANGITGLNKSLKEIHALRDKYIDKVRVANGRENPVKHIENSKFIDARRRGVSSTSTTGKLFS
jgi:hypothetical protein